MPIFEYICEKCGNKIELLQKSSDASPICCEEEMKKIISLSSFILNGTGWYKTDYKNKETKNAKSH